MSNPNNPYNQKPFAYKAFWEAVSIWGTLGAGLVICVLSFAVSVRLGVAMVADLIVITAIANTIKFFYFKPRPENPEGLRDEIDFSILDLRNYLGKGGLKNFWRAFKYVDAGSFPSVHSARSMNQALLAAAYMWQWNARFALAVVAFAILVGISRVVKYKHFPFDVFSGFLLGAAVAAVTVMIW